MKDYLDELSEEHCKDTEFANKWNIRKRGLQWRCYGKKRT